MPDDYSASLDGALSYLAAIEAIRQRVLAGEPVPTTGYFRSFAGSPPPAEATCGRPGDAPAPGDFSEN